MPKISIVTVVFNGASTLEQTMQSVLSQTYSDIEYIIIDGGSTDGSVDIIQRYRDRLAYWISEPDDGIYDAMNKGMQYASGDWIYFLGADDILCNVLTEMAPQLEDPNAIYYGNVIMLPSGRYYCGRVNDQALLKQNICHQSIFYPKSVYKRFPYKTQFRVYADYIMNLECWANPNLSFIYLDVVIAYFNEQGFSSQRIDDVFFRERRHVIRRLYSLRLYCFYLLRVESAYRVKKYLHLV